MTLFINEYTSIPDLQREYQKVLQQKDDLRKQKAELADKIEQNQQALQRVHSLLSKKQQTNLFTNH